MSSGVLFFFGFFLPYVVVPWAERRLMLSLPTEAKMKKHLIICGYNRLTRELCEILKEFGIKYVVFEVSSEKVKEAIESGIKCILTDNSPRSFKNNGIESAIAVIIAWENVENVIDSLLAIKDFNVRKYVIHGDQRYTRYFLFAGAKKVFLPKNLVATTIARSIQGEIKIGRLEQKS